MLAAHPHNVKLLGNFLKTTIQTELMHDGFDVEHVRCVVLEVLFELLARRRQIFIHEDLHQETEVLVPVEADPGKTII